MNYEFLITSYVCFFILGILLFSLTYSLREGWYKKANILTVFYRGVLFILCSIVIIFTLPVLIVGTLFLIATIIMVLNHIFLHSPLEKELIQIAVPIIIFYLLIVPSISCLDWLEKTSDEYIRWHKEKK